MVETEVISSLISPWLTPTSLFILLNVVLATILLLNNHKNHDNNNDTNNNYDNQGEDGASLVPPPPQLTRAPSLFSRVASFNFSSYYSESHVPQQPDEADRTVTLPRAPSLLYRVASFNFCRAPPREADNNKGNDDVEEKARDRHVPGENSLEDDVHVHREAPKVKKVNNKKKKAKKNEVVQEVKKNEVKKEKETTSSSMRVEEEQVDSRADDFINRFKQNLKMQRLDSLLRYRNSNTVAA